MIISKVKLLALSFVLLFISFSNPVYIWFNPALVLSVFFCFFVFLFFVNGKIGFKFNKYSLFLLVVLLYVFVPFREYDVFKLYYFIFIFVCFLLFFLEDDFIFYSKKIYTDIMVLISFFSIVSSLFYIIKIPFPYVIVPSETREDVVIWYYFSIFLDSQILKFGSLKIYRSNGIFLEPGHFGIYLSIALSFFKDIFKSIKGRVLVLGILFTFSATAYLFLFIVLFFKYFSFKRIYILFIFLICSILLFLIPPIHDFLYSVILFKFENDSILDDRTKGLDYIDISGYSKYMFGKGLMYVDYLGIQLSDYRRFLLTSGLISLVLILIFYITLIYKSIVLKKGYVVLGLILALLVFLHRSWMFHLGFMWIYVAFLICCLRSNKNPKELL